MKWKLAISDHPKLIVSYLNLHLFHLPPPLLQAVHSSDKPFECKHCDAAFNRSSTLRAHMKTHDTVKRFKCPICNKGFHQKGNLKNHVFTHTGERPYQCTLCESGFNQVMKVLSRVHTTHIRCLSVTFSCIYYIAVRAFLTLFKRLISLFYRRYCLTAHKVSRLSQSFLNTYIFLQKNSFMLQFHPICLSRPRIYAII